MRTVVIIAVCKEIIAVCGNVFDYTCMVMRIVMLAHEQCVVLPLLYDTQVLVVWRV